MQISVNNGNSDERIWTRIYGKNKNFSQKVRALAASPLCTELRRDLKLIILCTVLQQW